MENYLKIGKVGKAHGLRGLFFVSERLDPLPEGLLFVYIKVLDSSGTEYQALEISSKGLHQSKAILSLKNYSDRTQLEKIQGKELYILKSDLKMDSSKSYLWKDLLGRKVFDFKGLMLGDVAKIYNLGASDIMQVDAVEEGKGSYDLPLIEDFFQMDSLLDSSKDILLSVPKESILDFWNHKD